MRIEVLMAYGAYALFSLPAAAQSHAALADPTQAGARVPGARYESAFQNYAPYREQPLETWRAVNDEVGRVGGHVGMFGGGHAGHASAKPSSKGEVGAPAAGAKEAPGQQPARGAPAAPGGHTRH